MNVKKIDISPAEINLSYEKTFSLTYQVFGKEIATAPVILVNHALTGNSQVAGTKGWWNRLIGEEITIDVKKYTIIAFDIPGNGFAENESSIISDYKIISTQIVAQLFWKALEKLNIHRLQTVIGGSIGGAIAWEMAFIKPRAIDQLLPIACSHKASDWLIGNVLVQDNILNHSSHPVEDARKHAMLLYRTPESLREKFHCNFQKETNLFEIESWLNHHGNQLNKRFSLASYKLMNHLLKTIGNHHTEETIDHFIATTNMKIHIISIDSDYMFPAAEQFEFYRNLRKRYKNICYSTIMSIHGHDAFLIEYQQLHTLLNQHFKEDENIKIRG